MSHDPGALLEDKCFPFLRVAPRPGKPREFGLTVVADRGMGPNRQADLLATAADYVDVAKFAMGLPRLLGEERVRESIAAYGGHGIRVFFAGELSELAIMQGVAQRYYEAVASLGGWGVEVSNAQVAMGLADKLALVALARRAGLEVVAECGRKGGVSWTDSAKLVASEARSCLDAGAWRVLVQAEGLNEGVGASNERLIQDLVADFGLERLIFQAKEPDIVGWFLKTFGNGVSLDVDDHQVLDLESLRRGMRKRGVFGLMASL